MSRQKSATEIIIGMLRAAGIVLAQGITLGRICRKLQVLDQSSKTNRLIGRDSLG
jgi:hypothetical protein